MKAPPNTSKPRVLCPRGSHLCRLVQVVDLGTQHFKQGDDGSRKIYFGFETCDIRHTFKDENGPEPFMLQIEFAWFMTSAGTKKTKLRAFVEQWFQKPFPDEQTAADFDFSKLLGKMGVLTVAHQPKKDGNMKAVIADIYLPDPPKPGDPPIGGLKAHNKLVCYQIADKHNDAYESLPEFLQKKIDESDEARGVPPKQQAQQEPVESGVGDDVPADDVPF